MGKRYTGEETRLIQDYAAQGLTDREIADKLNRTPDAIRNIRHRHNLKQNTKKTLATLKQETKDLEQRKTELERETTVQPTYPVDRWEFLWYNYTGNNVNPYGNFIKRTTLAQINFEDWDEGEVNDSGQYDTVCFMASRTIHLYESGYRRFLIGSVDGIRLTVYNDNFGEIFNSEALWGDHPFEQLPIDIDLAAGEYKILLEYYENLGAVRAKFNIIKK